MNVLLPNLEANINRRTHYDMTNPKKRPENPGKRQKADPSPTMEER